VLGLPWLFTSRLSVAGLGGALALLLWGTRRAGILLSVHGVTRKSAGGLFYPMAVVILFAIAHDQRVVYLISALVLIVSDTAAALLGSVYGRTRYHVEQDWRSIEGSTVFFLVTFLLVQLPLLLMTGTDRAVCVLVAIQVALVITLFEGVSLYGVDNLLVPLATYHLLVRLIPESPVVIGTHIGVLVMILLLLSIMARHSMIMKASGVMAATLFFYLVYSLAGAEWVLPPAIALIGLAALRSYRGSGPGVLPEAQYQVVAAFYSSLVALLILVAHDVFTAMEGAPSWVTGGDIFRGPFAGAIAGQLAIVSSTQLRPFNVRSRSPLPLLTMLLFGLAAFLIVGPVSLWVAGNVTTMAIVTTSAVPILAAVIYWTARTLPGWPAVAPWNMRLQAASVGLATAIILPFHLVYLAG
jgi:dolichol kinase